MRFADPKANIGRFELEPGSVVADFGAGGGEYTLKAAEVVGHSGVVYAIDVQQDLLKRLSNRAKAGGHKNIEVVWGDIETLGGSTLPAMSVDALILSNTLFQVENKEGLFKEIDRVVKRNGKVLVIDWKDSFGGMGPEEDALVLPREAKDLFLNINMVPLREMEAGSHHYGILFIRKDRR